MKIFGLIMVFACVFGGFMWAGGKMEPIMKALPYEITIIGGAAIGAFLIANSMHTIKATLKNMNCMIKAEAHDKEAYLELLSVLYMVFKLARTKGWLALEDISKTRMTASYSVNSPVFTATTMPQHSCVITCVLFRSAMKIRTRSKP